MLLPPISYREFYGAYVTASIMRGIVVGLGVWIASLPFAQVTVIHPLWALVFALLGGAMLGTLGIIAGIWADKFDQLAAPPRISGSHAADHA